MVVASPFYEILVQKIFAIEGINAAPLYKSALQEIGISIKIEIKKLILALGLVIISFFVNFIPILGQILFLILQVFGFIIFNGITLYEPILKQDSLRLRDQMRVIIKRPLQLWPNIAISGFLIAIPILNLIILPFAITGSILHYIKVKSS
jgi:uncharacterized protein involved in cysteine biosynthesis